MLKFEEICDLVRLVGTSGVARVEIEHAGGRVAIDGRPPVQVVASGEAVAAIQQPAPTPASASPPTPASAAAGSAGEELEDGLVVVPSPIVGTFYRAPNPDADPYVKVGDEVTPGQVLCIVEAMKLMNEIECELAGKIVKIFPDNAEPVEYGQALFAIRPA
jgi:acetyl-CoA carboxylase biotin carboxyl carrier protein